MTAWAIIVALSAVPANAVAPEACWKPASHSPSSFEQLRDCQTKVRADAVAAADKKGSPLTPDDLEQVAEFQRAEARAFLAQSKTALTGDPASDSSSPQSGSRAKILPARKLGGVTAKDLSRVEPTSAAAVAALQARLQAAAGDGADGITPDMAADIQATLQRAQGGISPDMADLLGAVARDGGRLTPDTMLKLQRAARSAQSEGVDLNIDPDTQRELLEHDFEADKPAFNAAQQSPGTM